MTNPECQRPYEGQFDTCLDPLFVAIPRLEILTEMAVRGEHDALNDVCLAVAVVADLLDGMTVTGSAD